MRSRSGLKGRHWVAIWLAGFLVVALLVVRRQSAAIGLARDLDSLRASRAALEVSHAALASGIQRARSRAVLVPLAQRRLGLRLPQDSEITILQDPERR